MQSDVANSQEEYKTVDERADEEDCDDPSPSKRDETIENLKQTP